MKHIILHAKNAEGIIFDAANLAEYLGELTDTRGKFGKVYGLGMVLTTIILAKLSGQDKPSAITSWIRLRCDAFVHIFQLKHHRMPCLNTIRTILRDVVSEEELERVLNNYLHEKFGGQESELITLDGKTMRGTIPKGKTQGVHLLAAYLPEEGVVLKQMEVDTKENEIVVAPELIKAINVKNKVVCADAMQTQRGLSMDVLRGGGDYIWPVKSNQPTLEADVQRFFVPPRVSPGWHIPAIPFTKASESCKGHGRIEKRTMTLIVDDEQFIDWPGIQQVFRLEREMTCVKTGKKSKETVFGITSCSPERGNAEQLLKWTRSYWGIENGLHYRRDATLKEDATRISEPALARVIATINNFIVGLTQKLKFKNLAEARRTFDARIAMQLA